MASEPVIIPEKIYFKIGEVCDLLGVQPHVLRYWETEFPMLSPQKNKSGQRSYRRRDVEMAVRIKQLLYHEMFTIAGARKKLQSEARGGAKAAKETVIETPVATAPPSPDQRQTLEGRPPMLFDTSPIAETPVNTASSDVGPGFQQDPRPGEVLRNIAGQLLEIREMLKSRPV